MNKFGFFIVLLTVNIHLADAQRVLNLDDCRYLAIQNNKKIKISDENIKKAEQERKTAFTQYLPDISLSAIYMYNQKNISLLDANKYLPVGTMKEDGNFEFSGQFTVIPKSQFELDIQHIFMGNLSLLQPIFMGGKIKAYNKITDYNLQLAENLKSTAMQDMILQVDETYWQTVSLAYKLKLADNLALLLNQMNNDMEMLIQEGMATKADGLSVKVKLNEAEMAQTQASNGLRIAKMALSQLCGLPLQEEIVLVDETSEIELNVYSMPADVNEAYAKRSELKSLDLAAKIFEKKEDLARSEMLPTVALIGNYMVSNPNSFNGFQNKFAGMWNVGVMVNVPVFHWGEHRHKLNVAKSETQIKRLEWEEAKEKIELQVNLESFKVSESQKKQIAAQKNKENAEENLRYANLGFKEGVISATNVMEAQTAWHKAHSDLIDALIEVQLSKLRLTKAMGKLMEDVQL